MKKPVQVAGAVITSGLLFWPAHAEAPAAAVPGISAGALSASGLVLHGVRSASEKPAEQRLRVLAQYTESDEPAAAEPGEDSGETSEPETTEESSEEPAPAGEGYSSASLVSEVESSDTVNEVPASAQPEPASYAPEQGETAAQAAGDDRWPEFKLSTGFDYSSGDYGASEDTNILFIPVSGQFETRSWKFKVTVPWIRIEGPSGVLPGDSGGVVGGPGPVIENSGLGDIVATATYKLPPLGEGAPFIDLTAKVKFPTADEDKFLGTGAYDFTGQADIFHAFGDLTLFGTFGYRVLGEPQFTCFETDPVTGELILDPLGDPIPTDCGDLNNGFVASGGFAYKFNDAFSGGGILDWREASTDLSDDPFEVIPYVVWKVHENWSVQAYGVFGLSDGSPDAGGGLQISVTFN
ncbi:MAG: hypothetical protein ACLFWF_11755 [Alphaproteobacteria bacterium]